MDNLFFALQITRGGFTRSNISCKIITYIYIVGKCTGIMIYLQKNTGMEKDNKTKKDNNKDKQAAILLWCIGIIGGIAVVMVILYWCNFPCPFSKDQADWGNFGSYMGSITGLLAFMGVLYSIHNANKKTEKLREETQVKEERDMFFRLIDSHRKMLDSLTGTDLKTGEKTIGAHSIDVYKKELDADFQLLVTLWGASLFPDYESWSQNLGRFAGEGFELTLFAALFHYDSGQINKEDKSLVDNEQIVNNVNSIKNRCFHELRNDLRNAIHHKTLKPIYVNFSTEEMDDLSIYFNNVWSNNTYKGLPNPEILALDFRYSILRLTARCFYTRNEARLSTYLKNLGNITDTINKFSYDREYYMNYWISNLNSLESTLLFFYLLSGKNSIDILRIAVNNNLFQNIRKDQLFTSMPYDKEAIGILNEFLQMQIEGRPENLYPDKDVANLP